MSTALLVSNVFQGILTQVSPPTTNTYVALPTLVDLYHEEIVRQADDLPLNDQVFTTIRSIFIANITGADATFSIYASSNNSGVYSAREALFYNTVVKLETTTQIHAEIPLNRFQTIGVQTGTANALVFTFFGEVTEGE
tara:strand:- start:294 stop:710 length:417 start_codon:yes stop_codon:yes gene_type:complete